MTDEAPAGNAIFKYVAPGVLLLAGIAGFIALSSLKKAPASSSPKQQAATVQTEIVERHQDGLLLTVDGEVSPYREVTLSAEVAGRIAAKMPECRSGRFVAQDSVLMQIDPTDYDLELKRLQETDEQADISLEELDVEFANNVELIAISEESLDLQRKELRRIESLYRRKVATESEFDTAKNSELTARNNLQTLKNSNSLLAKRRARLMSEKELIQTELEKAQLDRARTVIRAPISGVVMEDKIEAGAFVQRGTMLVTLEDTSKVDVDFNLRMDQLRWLWQHSVGSAQLPDSGMSGSYGLPKLPVTATLKVGQQEFVWNGRLARYDGAGINAATRTVPCVAVVDDPTQVQLVGGQRRTLDLPSPPALLRGMFVSVGIRIQPQLPLLRVPEAAVRPGNKVWVYRDEKLAIERIEVLMTIDGQAIVLGDGPALQAGDHVVTSPLAVAVAGMPLRLPNTDTEETTSQGVVSKEM